MIFLARLPGASFGLSALSCPRLSYEAPFVLSESRTDTNSRAIRLSQCHWTVGAGFKPALCSKQRPDGEGRFETCPYGIWVAVGSKRGGQRLDSLSQCHCPRSSSSLVRSPSAGRPSRSDEHLSIRTLLASVSKISDRLVGRIMSPNYRPYTRTCGD